MTTNVERGAGAARSVSKDGLPPGPSESPLRQLLHLVIDPFGFFADCERRFGPIFTMRILGQDPWVMIGDPEAVRAAFRMSSDELHSAADGIKFLVGQHSIIFLDGETHRRERRILTPPFKHERMAVYAERMLARANDAIDRLVPGQIVEAHALATDITLSVIVECIFGVANPTSRDRLAALFRRHLSWMQTAPVGLVSMALGGDRSRALIARGTARYADEARTEGPLPSHRSPLARFFATKAEVDAMLKLELDRCRRDPGDRDDVLALLARATYDGEAKMVDEALLDELFLLMVAGHDTSSITLTWALWFLLTHPEALARTKAEIDEVFGDGPITARAADRLRYVPAVVEETLRLRPIATSVTRKLVEPMTLGGFPMPAGARVFPAAAILHFRPDLWAEPQAFRPERFLDQKPSPFHYLPFGGGTRSCLGRPFAMLELRLVLSQILRRVDLSVPETTKPRPQLRGVFVGPSNGVPLRVERVRPRSNPEAAPRERVAAEG